MQYIVKDIVDIQYELKCLINRAEGYRNDVERGIHVNTEENENYYTGQVRVNSLLEYLTDAGHDIERMRDDMKELQERLTDLVDSVEYESIRLKVIGR